MNETRPGSEHLANQGFSHAKEINAIMVAANEEFLSELGSEQPQNFRMLLKHAGMKHTQRKEIL